MDRRKKRASRAVMSILFGGALLPDEFQQVEWVQSGNSGIINSGIVPNVNTGFFIDYITYSETSKTGGYGCLFGSRSTSRVNEFQLTTYTDGLQIAGTFRRAAGNFEAGIIPTERQQQSLRGNAYYNGNGDTIALPVVSFGPGRPIFIGGLNSGGATQASNTRFFSLILYDGENIVRNFIPCYRISDGVVGLYDLATESFYSPFQGLFTKGNDV